MQRQSQERLEIADKEKEVALEEASKKFEQNLQERDQLHIKVFLFVLKYLFASFINNLCEFS